MFEEVEGWNHKKGNRIVQLDYVLQWSLQLVSAHSKDCPEPRIRVNDWYDASMNTTVQLECTTCGKLFLRQSEDPMCPNKIRRSLVVGTLTSGGTHSSTGELLAAADIPWICFKSFIKDEENLDQKLEILVQESFEAAVEEEKKHSDAGEDDMPTCTVFVDGCYGTRSYNNKGRSTYAGAVIIGRGSKKILYADTRSSYCLRCLLFDRKGVKKPHKCFKNFVGPAGRMESAILKDGVLIVYRMGLKIIIFVGDGDCCSFDIVKDSVPFGHEMRRQRCRNHITRSLRRRFEEVRIFFAFF